MSPSVQTMIFSRTYPRVITEYTLNIVTRTTSASEVVLFANGNTLVISGHEHQSPHFEPESDTNLDNQDESCNCCPAKSEECEHRCSISCCWYVVWWKTDVGREPWFIADCTQHSVPGGSSAFPPNNPHELSDEWDEQKCWTSSTHNIQ